MFELFTLALFQVLSFTNTPAQSPAQMKQSTSMSADTGSGGWGSGDVTGSGGWGSGDVTGSGGWGSGDVTGSGGWGSGDVTGSGQ